MASFRRVEVLLCDHDSVQHEPEDIPVVEGAPVGQGMPDVETGAVGLTLKTSGGGLSPPTPNSVEPNGMPTRPTGNPSPIPVGDEADEAGAGVEPPAAPRPPPPPRRGGGARRARGGGTPPGGSKGGPCPVPNPAAAVEGGGGAGRSSG